MKILGIIFMSFAALILFMALLSMFDVSATKSFVSIAIIIAAAGLLFLYLHKIEKDEEKEKKNKTK